MECPDATELVDNEAHPRAVLHNYNPSTWEAEWEDYHIFKGNLNWFHSKTLSRNEHTEAWGRSSAESLSSMS